MPVTKTAKRALRVSDRKKSINAGVLTRLETAIRKARKTKSEATVRTASSLADRASKVKVIHKNKASRIKSQLSKLLPKSAKKDSPATKKPAAKKATPKKKK